MTDAAKTLLEIFDKCPICDKIMTREDIKINDSAISLSCTCGWSIQVKDDKVSLLFK